MRGLDGNYLNTQGDATARMQVNYMAEVNRQQLKAQVEGMESLRKLREQVNEAEKEGSAAGPRVIREDQGSDPGSAPQDYPEPERKNGPAAREKPGEPDRDARAVMSHIDIRV